ncbi:hypothetical protein D3C72_679430 [compost metagenome]
MVRHPRIEHPDVFFECARLGTGARRTWWRRRITIGPQQPQCVDSRRLGRRIADHLTQLVALKRTFANGRLQRLALANPDVEVLALAVG